MNPRRIEPPRRAGLTQVARWTAGACQRCGWPIVAGDRLISTSRGWDHQLCPTEQVAQPEMDSWGDYADSIDGEVLADRPKLRIGRLGPNAVGFISILAALGIALALGLGLTWAATPQHPTCPSGQSLIHVYEGEDPQCVPVRP